MKYSKAKHIKIIVYGSKIIYIEIHRSTNSIILSTPFLFRAWSCTQRKPPHCGRVLTPSSITNHNPIPFPVKNLQKHQLIKTKRFNSMFPEILQIWNMQWKNEHWRCEEQDRWKETQKGKRNLRRSGDWNIEEELGVKVGYGNFGAWN